MRRAVIRYKRPAGRDTAYDRVRFAYLTAAVAFVVAAGCAAFYRIWFVLPAAAVLIAATVWRARVVLRRFRRP
jgi:hypothetical protein